MSNPPSKRRRRPNPSYKTASKALHSSSPLIAADVHALLFNALSEKNWSELTPSEQRGLIDLMPPPYRVYEFQDGEDPIAGSVLGDRDFLKDKDAVSAGGGVPVAEGMQYRCPLSAEIIMGDKYLKAATNRFKADVEAGCYEARWQTEARKAMRERREGVFDEYLREHAGELFDEQDDQEEEPLVDEGGIVRGKREAEAQSGSDWGRGSSKKTSEKRGKTGQAHEEEIPAAVDEDDLRDVWVEIDNSDRRLRSHKSN